MKIELWKTEFNESGYVTDEILDLKPCEYNLNEENRIKAVTSIAAISRGKDNSNNPEKRYKSLLVEAASNDLNDLKGVAGRPFEYIPVVLKIRFFDNIVSLINNENNGIIDMSLNKFLNEIMPFSYIENDLLFTNMRALLNSGIHYEDIPYNTKEESNDFKIVKIKAPHFVFDQLYTHTQLSKIAVSERVVETNDYWLPVDFKERIDNCSDTKKLVNVLKDDLKYYDGDIIKTLLNEYTQKQVIKIFKELKYPKEIYQRWSYGLKYKEFIMSGWKNDPKRWDHLFIERSVIEGYKNWTQETTKETVKAIYEIIKG